MKHFAIALFLLIILSGCFMQQDASARLVQHFQKMEKIFENNQYKKDTLINELTAYADKNMTDMQNGIKALQKKIEKAKKNPVGAFDLIAKVTQISRIIVNIRNNYGNLLNDTEVSKAFMEYGKVFSAIENIAR